MNKPNKIILHHAGGSDASPLADSSNFTVKQCDELHKKFGMKSKLGYWVGYHYFIDKNGIITQTRSHDERGAHTVGQNGTSIGICLAGNFDLTLPTDKQVIAIKDLLLKLTKDLNINKSEIYPHRHYAKKTCYGNKLSDDWGRTLIAYASNEPVRLKAGDKGTPVRDLQKVLFNHNIIQSTDIDGIYGTQTDNAIKKLIKLYQ